jgi:hypothetical protein
MQFSRNDFLLNSLLNVLQIRKKRSESFADFFADLYFTHQRIHRQYKLIPPKKRKFLIGKNGGCTGFF